MLPPFPSDAITTFAPNTPNFIYSNFYPHSVRYHDLTFPTSEHAYQAEKTLDGDIRMMILRCGSAAAAKKLGKTIQIRPDWDAIKLQVMYEILKEKFKAGGPLEKILWATGDAEIIEGNYWHDIFWGQCYCAKHNWAGQNYLGRLHKKVRSEIEGWKVWNASKN